MSINRIVSFDPGKRTGYVIKSCLGQVTGEFDYSEIKETMEFFWDDLNTICLIEDYLIVPGRKITHSREPLKVIGVIEFLFHNCKISPSSHKEHINSERLKCFGLWSVGKKHANDAARHLVNFAINNKEKLNKELVNWVDEGNKKYIIKIA